MRCLFLITKKGDDVIYLVRNWATLVLVQYIYFFFFFGGTAFFWNCIIWIRNFKMITVYKIF